MIKGIIIEGSDCSGKTTLIDELKKRLSYSGWDIINLGHENRDQFKRYMNWYINSDKAIFDRGHFSEIVYGDLWRGGHGMSTKEIDALNEYVFNNFLVVFAYAPEDVLKQRYHSRSYDQIIKSHELAIVQSHLENLLTHPNVLKYDSTSLIARDTMVEKILLLIEL
jgi:thymidylate kinase